ncbi:hypothetical protein IJJ54_01335 [Candidatus Saccharibacteria bacterium]|nr:hypothetical protein [Candidatus Saccharibacteria bacterium]
MRQRFNSFSRKKIITLVSAVLLVFGIAGVAIANGLSSASEGNSEIIFDGATSIAPAGDGGYDINYEIDGDAFSIGIGGFYGDIDTQAKTLSYDRNSVQLIGNFEFYYNGDFASKYSARVQSQDGFQQALVCNFTQNENTAPEGVSNCVLPEGDYGLPDSVSLIIASAEPENPYDDIQNPFQIFYDGVNSDFTSTTIGFNMGGDELSNVTLTLHGMTFENGKSVVERNDLFANNSEIYYEVSDLFDPETMQIVIRGESQYQTVLEVVDGRVSFVGLNVPGDYVNLTMESKRDDGDNPEPRPDHPGEETSAQITITSTSAYAKSYANARIDLNARTINTSDCDPDTECDTPDSLTINDFRYNYDAENDNGMVTFDFATLFIEKYVNKITINNVDYDIPIDYSDELSCLQAYDHQLLGFSLQVPKADAYNIVVDVTQNEGRDVCISNFLWTSNPELAGEDIYIAHSRLELVRLEWMPPNTPEEDEDEARVVLEGEDLNNLPEWAKERGMVLEFDDGSRREDKVGELVVPAFTLATMRIVPEYGYQVTSFGINGQNVFTGDAISEFTFNVHKGNFHLGAEVTAVKDAVKSETAKVTSGSIQLGGLEIDSGTAVLTVSDANVNNTQIANFQNAAPGYEVSTFLDVNLGQVFYKGDGDSDNYWDGVEMKNLVHDATVTLRLTDGVDGNSVVIIHEKHDGTYEVIPTTYNPANHTITFKTSSFSNYAIASTTTENVSDGSTPNTSDRILPFALIFLASVCGVVFAIHHVRQSRNRGSKN